MECDIKLGSLGAQSDRTKRARREAKEVEGQKFRSRMFEVTNYQEQGILASNCHWSIAHGDWNQLLKDPNDRSQGKLETKNGLQEMFYFRFHPSMPQVEVAVRRILCLWHEKGGCYEQLSHGFEPSKSLRENKMFLPAKDCIFKLVLGGKLNDWNFVKLQERKDKGGNGEKQMINQNFDIDYG